MDAEPLSPLRRRLCGRDNADLVAQRLCEEGNGPYSVVRTRCELQPYRVLPSDETTDDEEVELEVVML